MELTPTDLTSESDSESDNDTQDLVDTWDEVLNQPSAPAPPPSPTPSHDSQLALPMLTPRQRKLYRASMTPQRRKVDYLGRKLPEYNDTTKLHAAQHYSQQANPQFRSTSDRFGNGVDLATRGVKTLSNVALSSRERTPGVGQYVAHLDRNGRQDTIAGRASTVWHQ